MLHTRDAGTPTATPHSDRAPWVVAFDSRVRRGEVPQRLGDLGVSLLREDLGHADYLVGRRIAVLHVREADLATWVGQGRFHRRLRRARAGQRVVILERTASGPPANVLCGMLTNCAADGVPVLEAASPDEVASWIARLAEEERRRPVRDEQRMTPAPGPAAVRVAAGGTGLASSAPS